MSATPKDTETGWGIQQILVPPQPAALEGHDGLRLLLAFARIQEQSVAERREHRSGSPHEASDEYFTLDEVLRLVVARAAMITGADGIAVALASEEAIVCRASFGRISPGPGVRLDPSSGFSGACLRDAQTVRCDDAETDSRVNPQACRSLGARSMVAVPLTAKRRVVGLIEAFSSEALAFNEGDVRSLKLLGKLILAAIHPSEQDRLAQLAGQILPQPPQQELEKAPETALTLEIENDLRVANEGEPFIEAAASALAATEADPVRDALVAAILDQANAEASPPPSQSSSRGTEIPAHVPAPAALPFEPPPGTELFRAPVFSFLEEKEPYSNLAWVAGLLLVAAGLGWAWIHHAEQLTSANTHHSTPFNPPRTDSSQPDFREQPAPKPGATPVVTGVRHWSSPESSTVVIDVDEQVQYETHTLDKPPRVYFDLPDTKMAPGLLNQGIDVDDRFIKRVRMAQTSEGTTRVVLDTKGISQVSVKLDANPYRLTIDVHKPPPASFPSFPEPSPATAGSEERASRVARRPRSEFRVALDAGHGGWDLGTVGRKGLLEKDLVLDIVARLGKLVEEKLGAEVVYTRQDDTYLPLEKRAEIANLERADLFLSVHANYSDQATARGVETYYSTTFSPTKARTVEDNATLKDVDWAAVDPREKVTCSHSLASDVQDALYRGLAASNHAIRNRGVKAAQYVVLAGTEMPAVLTEVSFVSSPADEDRLESSTYRQQIAEALYRGVARYRSQIRPAKLASGADGG